MSNVPSWLLELTGSDDVDALRDAFAALDPECPADWRWLAALLAARFAALFAARWRTKPPRCVGLSGGQGAGKSTLSAAIVAACRNRGLSAVSVSVDDFYLTKAERVELARDDHPLLATRGPPGTHDVDLCMETLQSLRTNSGVRVPVFDKGIDDRLPMDAWRVIDAPVDVVVFEGWCVGARSPRRPASNEPINDLEREQDPHGIWRDYIDAALAGPYQDLFALLDFLIYLKVPDLDAVRRWRLEQEEDRPPAQRMSRSEVEHFVAHYQRLTLVMLDDLPQRADVCVYLDADHRVEKIGKIFNAAVNTETDA